MVNNSFFDECLDQSEVKATIVEKYFYTWAKIMTATIEKNRFGTKNIAYVDLFAGPGRYKDGSISTPVRVVQKILADPTLCKYVSTVFNDKDKDNSNSLAKALKEIENVGNLKFAPSIYNHEVGDKVAAAFEAQRNVPILAFIDPWGYKGLSLRLVDSFLKDWGCDCIFFFNYARINAGISNPMVRSHMEALFGEDRVESLAAELDSLSPETRELTVIEALAQALRGFGHRFVLPFTFKSASGRRTTHHLILVTKHFKGYEVMKEIMASSSSLQEQGVPSFCYNPAVLRSQPLLFDLNQPLEKLQGMLLERYKGKTIVMEEIYKEHSIDRPYLKSNYKSILRSMEDDGIITVGGRKNKVGFADHLIVTFPG